MEVNLARARPSDATALEEMFQAFLQEAGYYLGSVRRDTGEHTLEGLGLEASPERNPYMILADGKDAGFAITSNLEDPEVPARLLALFIRPELRRQLIGKGALQALFGRRRGTWQIDVPLAFAPAAQFFAATLHHFSKGGVKTQGVVDTSRGRIAHRELEVSLPRERPRTNWVHGGGPDPGFPFDRSHHRRRRRYLLWAILLPIVGFFLAVICAWLGIPKFGLGLEFVANLAAFALLLIYIETVVTSILDRQDRGPILPPLWEEEGPPPNP